MSPMLLALGLAFLSPAATGRPVLVSVVATSDLHGAIEERDGRGGLALLGGYLENLRAERRRDGGCVVLIDSGDIFQGTLESSLDEGATVLRAYAALSYDAVAIGNHEFDFGPVGPSSIPQLPRDNPWGALQARAAEASFPFLAANLREKGRSAPLAWKNVRPSVLIERCGLPIGIVGVTSRRTLEMTQPENVRGLELEPPAAALEREARRLRGQGAVLVIAAAHLGGGCRQLGDPGDLSSCDLESEVVELARALPPGQVDLIAAGHTHQGMAHEIAGIPVVQPHALGRWFSRVDFEVDPGTGKAASRRIHPPQELCRAVSPRRAGCASGTSGVPARYAGRQVAASPAISRLLRPVLDLARERKRELLGVNVENRISRAYDGESALGNLFADLLLAARPQAQVALLNAGGLRADLARGPLTYGDVFEAYPFDNRVALVRLSRARLEQVLARHLQTGGGIWSIAGLSVAARCAAGGLEVELEGGGDPLVVATADFLATGSAFARLPEGSVELLAGTSLREELVAALRARGGSLRAERLLDPRRPRLRIEGRRPLTCPRSRSGK